MAGCARWVGRRSGGTFLTVKPPCSRFLMAIAPGVVSLVAMTSSGCLGYPTDGNLATPVAPAPQGASRLPELLRQLQQGGAGMELFDQPQSDVLAAQDSQG